MQSHTHNISKYREAKLFITRQQKQKLARRGTTKALSFFSSNNSWWRPEPTCRCVTGKFLRPVSLEIYFICTRWKSFLFDFDIVYKWSRQAEFFCSKFDLHPSPRTVQRAVRCHLGVLVFVLVVWWRPFSLYSELELWIAQNSLMNI